MAKYYHSFILFLFFSISSILFCQQNSFDCGRIRDSINNKGSLEEDVWCWQSLPNIIGGIDSLQKKLKYPDEAVKNNIEGKVYVNIIVDTTGLPICPEISGKKLGYGCDEEAIRVVMDSKFKPALKQNKYRRTSIVVPIVFSLKKSKQ
jgi:TonB family protein